MIFISHNLILYDAQIKNEGIAVDILAFVLFYVRVVCNWIIVFKCHLVFFNFYQFDSLNALSGYFFIKSIVYYGELVIFYMVLKVGLVFEILILL